MNVSLPPNIYRRRYRIKGGYTQTLYYVRFRDWKGIDRQWPGIADFKTAVQERNRLKDLNAQGHDFDADFFGRKVTGSFTFAEWAPTYLRYDDIKRKRSLWTDQLLIKTHLLPFFGKLPLVDFSREQLNRYIEHRLKEKLRGHQRALTYKLVSRGTVSNELSLLRRMLRVAARENYRVTIPSFEGLIVRTKRGGRALTEAEQKKALAVYAPWMRRLAIFAAQTCLSEGDLMRLTDTMIDEKIGVIRPHGGRKKSKVEQVSPLTDAARKVLREIKELRRDGAMVTNVAGLIFTHDDGSAITKGQIAYQIEKAIKSGIPHFTFHNYRNTALTRWARMGIHVDVAMRASGHSSVQMHKLYVDLQDVDVGSTFKSFSTLQHKSQSPKHKPRK